MISPLAASADNDPFKGAPSFSLRHRVVRAFWVMTWTMFAVWTPPQLRRWRILLLRMFGAKLHPTVQVYGSASVWYPANLVMKAYSSLGPRVQCYCMAPITIGAFTVVSQRAHLCTGTHDIRNSVFQLQTRPISIGSNAWICAEAFVGPGVTVGDGAVLAARAAAFDDIPDWEVHRGNPASKVKDRPRFERNLK